VCFGYEVNGLGFGWWCFGFSGIVVCVVTVFCNCLSVRRCVLLRYGFTVLTLFFLGTHVVLYFYVGFRSVWCLVVPESDVVRGAGGLLYWVWLV